MYAFLRRLMDVFASFVGDTASDGVFPGYSPRQLLVLFAALSRHDTIRRSASGRTASKTQLRLLENNFRRAHSLSTEQYARLLQVYNQAGMADVYSEIVKGVPNQGESTGMPYVKQYFQAETGPDCCGYYMKVRELQATAFARERAFVTKHIVKECRGQCGRTFYLNKRVYKERLGDDDVTTHTFCAWDDGVPTWIANKSGKIVISSELLTDFAIAQCCMR